MCGLVAAAVTVQAQQSGYLWVGGAMTSPSGDAGDAMKSGTMITMGGGWNIKSVKGLSLQAEYQMGSNDAKTGSASTDWSAFYGNLGYNFNPDSKLNWSAGFGLGSMSAKPTGGKSNSEMAWQLWFGPGYNINSKWALWGNVGYIAADEMKLMPIAVGLSLNLGTP
jgi:hypothetical protein